MQGFSAFHCLQGTGLLTSQTRCKSPSCLGCCVFLIIFHALVLLRKGRSKKLIHTSTEVSRKRDSGCCDRQNDKLRSGKVVTVVGDLVKLTAASLSVSMR